MKNVFKVFSFLVLVGAIVGGVILVQRNQETRKGAAANETSHQILPSVVSVASLGKSFDSHVWINTGKDTDKLLGAEFIIMYDPARLKYVSSEPQNGYTVLNDVVDDGKGTLTLKMVTLGTEKAGAVDILKVTFQLLAMDRENRRAIGMSGEIFVTGQTTNWVLNNGHPSLFGPETLPSGVPTAVPTTIPTTIPTTVPTVVPTNVPTTIPTVEPTAVPTGVPTVVPTAVPTVEPTAVPTINGQNYVLNYKIAFANVNPNSAKCVVNWPLLIKVSANGREKSYTGVMPTTREIVGNKLVFGGSLELVGFEEGQGVAAFISGPKQLQTKYGINNQATVYGKAGGELILTKSTSPVYDFSNYPMLAGDVVSNTSIEAQDGNINGVDFAYIKSKSLIHETVAEGGFLKGDLDGNCQVNSNDVNIIKMSLQDKQGQLY